MLYLYGTFVDQRNSSLLLSTFLPHLDHYNIYSFSSRTLLPYNLRRFAVKVRTMLERLTLTKFWWKEQTGFLDNVMVSQESFFIIHFFFGNMYIYIYTYIFSSKQYYYYCNSIYIYKYVCIFITLSPYQIMCLTNHSYDRWYGC